MNIIEVKNLTRKFKELTAVDNISFYVAEGEVFGFLGPNGAGKSTTIKMLCTLLQPTSGSGRVAGHDIVKEPARVREHIGLVAEKIILYDRLTALENLMFFGSLYHLPKKEIKVRAMKWLKALEMDRWADKLTGTFSTGMKQRVNIARALLTEPEVLMLDEPSAGLSPKLVGQVFDTLKQISDTGVTIVLVEQNVRAALALTERALVLVDGKLAHDGPTNVLLDGQLLGELFLGHRAAEAG